MDKKNGRRPRSARQVKRTSTQKYAVKLFIPHVQWLGRQRKSLELVLTTEEYRQLFYCVWNSFMSYRKGKWQIDEVVQNAHVWAVRFVSHYFAIPDPDDPHQWQPLLDAIDFEQSLYDPEFEKYGFNLEAERTSNATVLNLLCEIIENATDEADGQLRIHRGWMRWRDSFNEEVSRTYALVTFPFSNLIPELVPIDAATVTAEPFDNTLEGYCYLLETFSPYGLFRIGNTLSRLYPPKHKVDIGAAVDYVRQLVGVAAIHRDDLPEMYAKQYTRISAQHARLQNRKPSFPMVTAILASMVCNLLRKTLHSRTRQ